MCNTIGPIFSLSQAVLWVITTHIKPDQPQINLQYLDMVTVYPCMEAKYVARKVHQYSSKDTINLQAKRKDCDIIKHQLTHCFMVLLLEVLSSEPPMNYTLIYPCTFPKQKIKLINNSVYTYFKLFTLSSSLHQTVSIANLSICVSFRSTHIHLQLLDLVMPRNFCIAK